jgi:hypothetical protein
VAISTISDSGGQAGGREGGVLRLTDFTVDIDALWSTANKVLSLGDVVDAVSRRTPVVCAGSYGGFVDEPAKTWAARYGYLLKGVATEMERSGYDLRATADAYYETELVVRDRLRQLESWHSTTTAHAP